VYLKVKTILKSLKSLLTSLAQCSIEPSKTIALAGLGIMLFIISWLSEKTVSRANYKSQ